jgi:hypothetical protein
MAKEIWDRRDGKVPVGLAGPEGVPVQLTNIQLKKFSVVELKVFRALLNKATIREES